MSTPNVLVVVADDLGYGDLGCYGAEYDTPNVDRLAAGGVRFTDWHANGPICSPTRAALLTGQYPQAAGVPGNAPQGRPHTVSGVGLPPDRPTLADRLSKRGYRCGAFGKWHLGASERDDPLAHGFDEYFGFLSGCVDYYSHLMVWQPGVDPYHDLWEDRTEVWCDGEYLTHLITDRAVSFVEDASEPFVGYVAYNAPHYPTHAPPSYFDRFPHLVDDRRTQAAMIAALDDGVGELLDALASRGITEDTIVVFTSDHGPSRETRNHLDGSGDPYVGGDTGGFRGHKFSLFEGGTRVPGIVRYPGAFDGGRETDALALTMDVLPTVLDYCDERVPDVVDGRSLRPIVETEEPWSRDPVFWGFQDQLAVRDGDWRLVVNGRDLNEDVAEIHLSDLSTDPGEVTNLDKERSDLANELASRVQTWSDRVE